MKYLKWYKTCEQYPEQYDIKLGGELVGHVRIRHGYATLYSEPCGEEYYDTTDFEGDGSFYNNKERSAFKAKCNKILRGVNK